MLCTIREVEPDPDTHISLALLWIRVAPEPRGIKVLIGPVVSEQRLFVRADPVYEIKKNFSMA